MKKIISIESFKFEKGGYYASKFELLLQRNTITFYSFDHHFDRGVEHRREISMEALALFISRLNEIDILHWKNKYDNQMVSDGVQWEIEIKYNSTCKKRIYGSNQYPGYKPDSSGITSEFTEFLGIIENIIQHQSVSL